MEDVFDDFLCFFFPDAYEHFDLRRGVEWLDKELEQLFPPEGELYSICKENQGLSAPGIVRKMLAFCKSAR